MVEIFSIPIGPLTYNGLNRGQRLVRWEPHLRGSVGVGVVVLRTILAKRVAARHADRVNDLIRYVPT